jgi:hypothetical protein
MHCYEIPSKTLKCEDTKEVVQERCNAFYPYSNIQLQCLPFSKRITFTVFRIKIDFEIFCIDDASKDYQSNNSEIQFYQIASIINCQKISEKFNSKFPSKSRKLVAFF